MTARKFLVLVLIGQSILITTTQPSQRFFRKDYTYLIGTESFYKIHTIHRTYEEAIQRCELEGATLFYPEDENEANAVITFWNQTQPFLWVYVGINDFLVKEVFETIDGRPILDVFSNWAPGEPNDVGGIEDCVALRRDGTLYDVRCNRKDPFICKKALSDLKWNQDCDMPNTDYVYDSNLGRCYKFHTDPKNWTEAVQVCSAEQSYLAIINSQTEADYLVQLNENTTKKNEAGLALNGVVLLGFHNRNGKGWKTIKGEKLDDSGYSTWGGGQPDGGDNEQCGSMFFNGQLNDLACNLRVYYICEHEVASLEQDINERFTD